MDNYLRRYVGTYRVKAHYDLDTNDYPRDEDGNLDQSFGDFYIECQYNTEIKHGYGAELSAYIPTLKRGKNALRKIYSDKIDNTKQPPTDDDKLCEILISNNILNDIDIMDTEVMFTFPAKDIDYYAELLGAKTRGASINPLSPKNLPKKKSTLPSNAISAYKAITTISTKDKSIRIKHMQTIRAINKTFAEKYLPKNATAEMKESKCDLKSYIYQKGLWDKYLDTLNKSL